MDTNPEMQSMRDGWPPRRTSLGRGLVVIAGLFLVGVAATLVLEFTGWDLAWSEKWYVSAGAREGWAYSREQPWAWLYDYGELPGWVLVIGALILYAAARVGKARPEYQRTCLAVVLTVALGPGLLVNGILKEYWGRPRPAQVSFFGGQSEYRAVWPPGGPGQGKSFSCGHCSMAFAVTSAAAFYPMHPALSVGAFVIGTAYGTIMSVARTAQGGHFATDCVWSGIIVVMVFAGVYYLVLRIPSHVPSRTSRGLHGSRQELFRAEVRR